MGKETAVQDPTAVVQTSEIKEAPTANLPAVIVPVEVTTEKLADINSFTAEQQAQIKERAKSTSLKDMKSTEVVLWGSRGQKEVGIRLDALLSQVTRKDNPIVFEVFKKVKKGIKDTNLSELEEEIRKSLAERWYHGIFKKIGIDNADERIEAMQERFRELITGKVQTLQGLTGKMEGELQDGIRSLIGEGVVLEQQVDGYRKSVTVYGMDVAAGRIILEDAKLDEAEMLAEAKQSKDPLKAQTARDFQRRIQQFHSRLLILMTAYTDAPVTLEMLSGIEAAGLETLSETANSSLEDFNKIKSLLLMLTALYKIKSVQVMNAQRRVVKQQLQSLTTQLYEVVATDAAKAVGDNRLEDAQLVLSVANALENIGDKVESIHTENTQKFAEAEKLLIQAKEKIRQIGLKETTRITGDPLNPLAKY